MTTLAASFGLALGLGLGITGIAGAVGSPGPAPSTGTHDRDKGDHHGRDRGPGFGKGFPGMRGGPGGPGFRGEGRHAGGLVTAFTASSLTVATPSGPKTFGRDAKTTYAVGKDARTASVLAVGKVVMVELVDPSAAKPVAERITVVPAHLAGVVTKVEGSTVTIVDRDGFTRAIHVSGTPTAKVGDFVLAVGSVGADGTTLEATELRTHE